MSQCWMKRGACLCICSPLGRSLLPGLKSSKQSPLASKKAWILCLQLSSRTQSLSMCIKLLSLSLCNSLSLYRAPAVQIHGRVQWSCSLTPILKHSFPRLARTPYTGIPPPPPSLGEMVPWIGCCAVENQPLMGSGGESESEGGGRREENPAEKEWHHLCSAREREREKEKGREGKGGSVNEERLSRGKLH